MWAKHKQAGFTIVELLIVIVVIGILAAITIVSYSGIQNRGYDVTIQSDLRNLANKIMMYQAEFSKYPESGSKSGDSTRFANLGNFRVSKGAYDTVGDSNLYYCDGLKGGQNTYVLLARSKSGVVFLYGSATGPQTLPNNTNLYSYCRGGWDASTDGYSYGYNVNPIYLWFSWTNG